jgi:uncharacterized Fe-S center protein
MKMTSKVYFLNDRAGSLAESTPFKGVKVLRDAGLAGLFKKGDKVGIKVHFGEWGNSLNLRPHWVGAVVDEVKRLGGVPSVIECCVVAFSETVARATKADHLRAAAAHGFTPETMGCPIQICDGDYGVDDIKAGVPNGVYLKHTFMGKGLKDFDAIIVVSHFKGHVMGVFGGAIKNVGIGMASARGKLAVHFISQPEVGVKTWTINQDAVKQIASSPHPNVIDRMLENCPHGAFSYDNGIFAMNKDKCKQCGYCFGWLFSGVFNIPPGLVPTWPLTISDSAAGIINAVGRDKFIFLNYAMDISPGCDCMAFHDRAMVPNIGVFASKDPVAVDMACIEAAEALAAVPGSAADEFGFGAPNTERFTNCSSMAKLSQWSQLNAAVYNGLGTTEYNLVQSEVADEAAWWFPPYSPGNPFTAANKGVYGKIDMDPGDYCYDYKNPRLPMDKLGVKPKGKAGEVGIRDQ